MVEPGEDVPEVLEREMKKEAVVESQAVDRLFKECRRGVVYRGHARWQEDAMNAGVALSPEDPDPIYEQW